MERYCCNDICGASTTTKVKRLGWDEVIKFFYHKNFVQCIIIPDSCAGRCGQSLDQSYNCQCNTVCASYGDCCVDYSTMCSAGSGDNSGGSSGGKNALL